MANPKIEESKCNEENFTFSLHPFQVYLFFLAKLLVPLPSDYLPPTFNKKGDFQLRELSNYSNYFLKLSGFLIHLEKYV